MFSRASIRFLILLVVLIAAMAASSANMLQRFALPDGPLSIAVTALLIASMSFVFSWRYVLAVLIAAVLANLPPETASALGYPRDYAIAVLIGLVLTPYITDAME